MKKISVLVLVALLSMAIVAAVQAAAPAPGGPFNTAFRVQNLEASNATCQYSLYDAAGVEKYTSSPTTVAPGDSLYVYMPDVSVAAGAYSAVVSCDKEVAAVVNFSDADSGASHSGVSVAGTAFYAPGIYDNYYGFYSNVYVQNATSAPVDVTVEIFAPGVVAPVKTQTQTDVPAYATAIFEQEGLTELADNKFYSAKITADGNVAAIVNIYGKGGSDGQLYSYNAFADGSLTAYAPVVMNNYYGFNTALVIQNISNASASVTVTYTNGTTTNHTIGAGASASIYTPSTTLPAGNTLYGATITSDQKIVVMVNQSNNKNRAATYTGFAAGATEVRAPIVMKNYYGFESSVICQNISASAADITVSYAGVAGTRTVTGVAAGKVAQFYQPTDTLLAAKTSNFISSATFTATQDIVCIVNQGTTSAFANTVYDQQYSYEGILVAP